MVAAAWGARFLSIDLQSVVQPGLGPVGQCYHHVPESGSLGALARNLYVGCECLVVDEDKGSHARGRPSAVLEAQRRTELEPRAVDRQRLPTRADSLRADSIDREKGGFAGSLADARQADVTCRGVDSIVTRRSILRGYQSAPGQRVAVGDGARGRGEFLAYSTIIEDTPRIAPPYFVRLPQI